MVDEKLCFKWNDFQDVLKASIGELKNDTDFSDVTLACEDQSVKAHKLILSACSPFFRRLLKSHPHPQPLVYMRGIRATELTALVDFIYHGEANIFQDQLGCFLTLAEEFELKGLSGNSEEVASELSKYPSIHKEPRQNLQRTNVITENKFSGSVPKVKHEESSLERAIIPTQKKIKQSVHIDAETQAKVESMIVKQVDGYSCTHCEYTSSKSHKDHMKEHVERHIEGLEYPCPSCAKVFRLSHSFRKHEKQCVKF